METVYQKSDQDLLFDIKELRERERELLVELIQHIQEVERRRLYLKCGHASLYHYLIRELGYTDSEAYVRVETARFVRQVPDCADDLRSGALTMTAISQARAAVKAKERQSGERVDLETQVQLVSSLRGQTKLEAQRTIAESLHIDLSGPREGLKALHGDRWLLELILNGSQKSDLDRAKDLLAHAGPVTGYSDLVARVLDHFLRRRDFTLTTQSLLSGKETVSQEPHPNPRRISMGLRRAVFRRDQGRCQFRHPDGRLCLETYEVELDHIIPVSKGGKSVYDNLQCLCRVHNHWKSDRVQTGKTTS